jgi:hypothetical protein
MLTPWQLTQLRASVNQFLYPLSKPEIHGSGIGRLYWANAATSLANSFAEQAQIASDLLGHFSNNHRKHRGIQRGIESKKAFSSS